MPQAGIHGMFGMAVKQVAGKKERFLLGLLLGSFLPDMDNLGVAVATLAKMPTEGIHRTGTHSIFFALAIAVVFYFAGQWKKSASLTNLGYGLGLGILFHSLLDLALWFNGVELFWPLGGEIDFWANSNPPAWLMTFMEPAEFLCLGLYLWILGNWARNFNTDGDFLKTHRTWMWLEFALFAIFTPVFYLVESGYYTIYGVLYLISLFMTFFVTIRMRKTVDAAQ